MKKVFVYGTLKRSYSNHHLLKSSTFLGQDTIKGEMYNLGHYPAIKNGENDIHGEVYEIDENTEQMLDILEGVPSFYQKHTVETKYGEAIVYKMGGDLSRFPIIKNGKF